MGISNFNIKLNELLEIIEIQILNIEHEQPM